MAYPPNQSGLLNPLLSQLMQQRPMFAAPSSSPTPDLARGSLSKANPFASPGGQAPPQADVMAPDQAAPASQAPTGLLSGLSAPTGDAAAAGGSGGYPSLDPEMLATLFA